ncbi:MAG: hypothetical protein ISR89_01600 [Candidatus Marinimicrobia bacterium]|nr:hypothetical protein [Candidatus Neomarinimicrobiota bacterium]MBL7029847.1 hypothetical protein [Candidatus Neomarinimicrobiota bacterium]
MVLGVKEAIDTVQKDPLLFSILIKGMPHENELIAMRSADAVEKLTYTQPKWLAPHKRFLIDLLGKSNQQEVLWHLAQIIPRLSLSKKEKEQLIYVFESLLKNKSRILVTFSMQAMVDLSNGNKELKNQIFPIIQDLTKTGSGAMRSRGRKLLKQMETT